MMIAIFLISLLAVGAVSAADDTAIDIANMADSENSDDDINIIS